MAGFDPFQPLLGISPRFTEEQLIEINAYFNEFAKPILVINLEEPINAITIKHLMTFLQRKLYHRRSFYYPTYFEIMQKAEFLKAGVTRLITRDQFIYMLDSWVVEPEIKHEILLAFQLFDPESRNYLVLRDIEQIITGYTDNPLNEAEAIEVLRDADVRGDGVVSYVDFIESIFKVSPELYDMKVSYVYDDPDEDPSVEPEPAPEPEPEPEPIIEEPPTPPPPPPPKGKKKK